MLLNWAATFDLQNVVKIRFIINEIRPLTGPVLVFPWACFGLCAGCQSGFICCSAALLPGIPPFSAQTRAAVSVVGAVHHLDSSEDAAK